MAKAKKLPSGSWRCLVYSHSVPVLDEKGNPVLDDKGKPKEKRIYESFTSDDPSPAGRRDVELRAAEFAANKTRISSTHSYSIKEAVAQYISTKSPVLSPSTSRLYISYQKHYFNDLEDIKLRDITNEQVQFWIGNLSKGRSPKTVRNIYGLLSAVIDMYAPHIRLKVKLPEKKRPELYIPSDKDVKVLLDHVAGTELEIAILLAAFGPLRRGEICALTDQDIRGNIVTVNKSMVLNADNEWVVKTPKTYSSNRDIEFPQSVIDKMAGIEGRIVKATPTQITNRFRRALKFSHLPNTFRFHDLRHYAASIMHAIGIPDQYIMQRGGWATDNVMKTVYRGTIDDQQKRMTEKILDHFNELSDPDATRNATQKRKLL